MKQFTHPPEDFTLSGMNIKKGMYIRAENWSNFVEVIDIEICKLNCRNCIDRRVILTFNNKYNVSCNYCQTNAPWIVKGE